MQNLFTPRFISVWLLVVSLPGVLVSPTVLAHCDSMDGPIAADVKSSFAAGDVTPTLKWITQEHEAEMRNLFGKTLAARAQGEAAGEIAELFFLETVVRLHRQGEGEPYTGLKPAGTQAPIVVRSDEALRHGSLEDIEIEITQQIHDGLVARFKRAVETRQHAAESVEAGREYVEAYVVFMHYVERLFDDATGAASAHSEPADLGGGGHHEH
ncbi:MAG TPA: DUF6448 family protein [Candidatus Deferrimicrobium sp.]|nr:DUF6448 family protein [Candidatus Deferrimicrobium sp.]